MFAGEEEQMPWSFTVGRVGETVVRIHLTLVMLLVWYAWEGWRVAGAQGAVDQFLFIALLFVSVLLHEFGHIRAARRYGIPTPDVILTPIGGVARIARMPDKPMQELVIALAGPLVTLVIAVSLALVILLREGSGALTALWGSDLSIWTALCWTNVVLLVFNLIPAFPMDGGRVLRALLASRIGMVRGTRIAARVGQVLAVVLAMVGLQYNIFLVLIAAFVFLGAEAEYEQVKTRDLAGDLTAGRLTVTDLRILPPSMQLDQAISLLTRSDQRCFPVLDDSGHLLGIVTRDDLLRGVTESGLEAPVTAAMVPPDVTGTISIGMPFEEAVARLYEHKRDALPVLAPDGRFVGLITRDNVTDVLLVQRMRRPLPGNA
jgi:Zn-dependent protease/CBS domain-containing protein